MESKNVFLAVLLSMAVLFGYQFFFPPQQPAPTSQTESSLEKAPPSIPAASSSATVVADAPPVDFQAVSEPQSPARAVEVTTGFYSAVVSEEGGTIRSFKLNEYREAVDPDSPPKELIKGSGRGYEFPLFFSWGADPAAISRAPVFKASQTNISTADTGQALLTMTGEQPGGLTITKSITFSDNNYLLDLVVEVANNSQTALKGSPYLSLPGRPFSVGSQNSRLFNGPVLLVDDSLEEVKVKKLQEDGPMTFQGNVAWTAYEDTYFMLAVAPEQDKTYTVRLAADKDDKIENILFAPADIISPGSSRQYRYTVYIGPKKMTGLKDAGHQFDQAINFGWFGFVAKPVLVLLNLIYKFIHNYGVAIILVTVLIKLFFWPITQKGMKSMKDMQKLQPKLTKLREKYKDDKERMAQEQMKLYQTHKINPVGGCLPMVLQIPVFFALYRVLMQAIELRHAPFMLWINDLSAPERLSIGFDLPYLGGLPLLTLLMGGSMFLQQKMSPTPAANQEMNKFMTLMPVIFTFIFINFASGLVLYFFVNNLLQMAQQYFINKDRK